VDRLFGQVFNNVIKTLSLRSPEIISRKPDMVVHIYNPCTREAEAGG
jgi:hypothetical protein